MEEENWAVARVKVAEAGREGQLCHQAKCGCPSGVCCGFVSCRASDKDFVEAPYVSPIMCGISAGSGRSMMEELQRRGGDASTQDEMRRRAGDAAARRFAAAGGTPGASSSREAATSPDAGHRVRAVSLGSSGEALNKPGWEGASGGGKAPQPSPQRAGERGLVKPNGGRSEGVGGRGKGGGKGGGQNNGGSKRCREEGAGPSKPIVLDSDSDGDSDVVDLGGDSEDEEWGDDY